MTTVLKFAVMRFIHLAVVIVYIAQFSILLVVLPVLIIANIIKFVLFDE